MFHSWKFSGKTPRFYEVVTAAVVGAGTAVYSSKQQAKAQKNAAQQQAAGGGGGAMQGLLSAYMTNEQRKAMEDATERSVAMADPFAGSRSLANQQLQSLMQTPGSVMNDPAGQWAFQQGQQAVDRSLAARHQSASGNALTELAQWGQGLANQRYDARLGQLGALASQGSSPTAAADALLKGTQMSQGLMNAATSGAMGSLSGVGGAVAGAAGNLIGGYQPPGALPQYSTGTYSNPTGFNTGIGGSGYTVASTGGARSQQSQMLASQW